MHEVANRMFDPALLAGCNIVLFEDEATAVELFPMAVLRPSWEIRCGAGCTRLWLTKGTESDQALILRPRNGLEAIASELTGGIPGDFDPDQETVFLNGRVIGLWRKNEGASEFPETVTDAAGRVLVARRSGSQAQHLLNLSGNEIAESLVQQGGYAYGDDLGWILVKARYVWDYMISCPTVLERQLTTDKLGVPDWMGARITREMPFGVHLTDRTAGFPIYLGQGAKLHPGVALGNHGGPIWIGSQTEIEPNAYVEGPIYVGAQCRVKAGTRLYHGTAIGNQCRVAGEISQSVFQGFVNKQHDGFVGNSVLGQWVNIGADTRTSNLRNDYGEVRVKVGQMVVRTGERFIGLMAGDHVKTGINTMFNTGTVVGVGANVYGAGYPPRFIGSYRMGGAEGLKAAPLESTLQTARIAMSRRGCTLSPAEEALLRKHYAETVTEESLK